MRLPEVFMIHGVAPRAVGRAVVDQPADDTNAAVGVAVFEKKRIGCKISVQFDFAGAAGVLLPRFQFGKTRLERFVPDFFCITHHFVVVLLTHDFHNVLYVNCE